MLWIAIIALQIAALWFAFMGGFAGCLSATLEKSGKNNGASRSRRVAAGYLLWCLAASLSGFGLMLFVGSK